MSAWPGKFVIGLTGNIATGKSVVRRMLEHVGAFGIDADALSNRAILKGAPGYQPVLNAFGNFLLDSNEEIDRAKLGQFVFTDKNALSLLESIIHPLVREAIDHLVRTSKREVIVIEAIKLLESPLRDACDKIWVTTSEESRQLSRLEARGRMSREQALLRMAAQSSHEEKVAQADTVIFNNSSIESTWEQVRAAWKLLFPVEHELQVTRRLERRDHSGAFTEEMVVDQARPGNAQEIANFIASLLGENSSDYDEVMHAFGEKAYLLLRINDEIVGLLGWKVENLVTRLDEIVISPDISFNEGLPLLIGEVEEVSRELQCEIVLAFVDRALADQARFWKGLGYQRREIQTLDTGAWQEAAIESFVKGSVMLFKQLRDDHVMRPI